MLEQTPHQTTAIAWEESSCLEVSRDVAMLLERKPHTRMDLLTTLGRQFRAAEELSRVRANRSPNEIIEQQATFGERIADIVAGFGGSWSFIILFSDTIQVYTYTNNHYTGNGPQTINLFWKLPTESKQTGG